MPRVAPLMPRKMLPPPTTTAISTPRSTRAAATSSAMRCTTPASMPKLSDASANASPDSLSTTRRNRLSPTVAPSPLVTVSPWSRAVLLLAHFDAREPVHRGIRPERPQQLPDRRLRVAHVGLLDEHVVLVEGL